LPLDRSQTEYFEQNIKSEDFSRSEVAEKKFYDCLFNRCTFVETVFKNCRFVNCRFDHCQLNMMKVPNSVFQGVVFEDSQLVGINWAEANWQKQGLSSPIKFIDCALNHSTFIGLHLPEIEIVKCAARNVDFREADLSKAVLTGTDFSDSLFFHTTLVETDFRRAKNYHINPTQNPMEQAKFDLPEAMQLLYALDILLDEPEGGI
jgi:fluoroquinolone resistance protein